MTVGSTSHELKSIQLRHKLLCSCCEARGTAIVLVVCIMCVAAGVGFLTIAFAHKYVFLPLIHAHTHTHTCQVNWYN